MQATEIRYLSASIYRIYDVDKLTAQFAFLRLIFRSIYDRSESSLVERIQNFFFLSQKFVKVNVIVGARTNDECWVKQNSVLVHDDDLIPMRNVAVSKESVLFRVSRASFHPAGTNKIAKNYTFSEILDSFVFGRMWTKL